MAAEYDPRLREVCMGEWSGRTSQEIQSSYAEQWQARLDDPEGYRPPNGENRFDVKRRVAPLLEELNNAPHDQIVLVSHGITIRVLLELLLGYSDETTRSLSVPNDLVYCVELGSADPIVRHYLSGEGPFEGLFISER